MNSMLQEIKGQSSALKLSLSQKEEILRLGEILREKQNILFLGIGSSYYALQIGKQFLEKRLGANIDLISSGDALFYFPEDKQYDVVIIASQSGESIETLEAARKLKEKGAKIWVITNTENSSIYNMSEEKLLMMAGSEVSSATKTYVNLIALLYALGLPEGDSGWNHLENCAEIIKELIGNMEGTIKDIARDLAHEEINNIYILGMGPHVATAQEAALLFKEKTWICTEGMSAAEFRHGSVEVIEKGVAVFLLGCNQQVDDFLQKMVNDLTYFGAKVYTVGDNMLKPPTPSQGLQFTYIEEEFLPLLQVIPFQLLSCYLGVEKGLDVDNFRHIQKVINSY